MKGQSPGVVGPDQPPDQDAAVLLADGQVPNAAVGRLPDPCCDLLGEGLHPRTL
jgi:hypothetical protein